MDPRLRGDDGMVVAESFRVRNVTLGILAGGRATRLGGADKAWLVRQGLPQVVRIARRFAPQTGAVLVSANRDLHRYGEADLTTVPDRHADIGPLGGLDALAATCETPWLFTLPVDIVDVNDCLLPSLASAGALGAFAEDDDGLQPLVALWHVDALRPALAVAIASDELSIHTLQQRIGMHVVRFAGLRFGNLNTPSDLAAAGFAPVRHEPT
jgi:molybdopterin-guanine dinucleotide biosynthesis protein A